eukprot:TRINITY_DN6507_c0_g1_i1.p2 TRINITY_DN6507_c0_g1~~TRINITY_DN6507_c0_g1_i1.p2  ORF type:complete len:466 (+),score=126.40 TRINITY_DN6507_c0_g1_i1:3055-4452(+)
MTAEKVIEIQQDIKHKAEDYRAFLDDLKIWENDIKKKDTSVCKKSKIEADYPPVRGTVNEDVLLKQEESRQRDDPVLREKALGNEFFKKGKYNEAIKHYSKGIGCDPDDSNVHLLYANRAMASLKLEKWADAEDDATKCVQSNRTYTKGFFRRALARKGSGKLKEAITDLNTVLVLEPENKEARQLIAQMQADVKKQEKVEAPPVQRRKLQIEEVDDDDDDDEEDEVDIPIRRKETTTTPAVPTLVPEAKAAVKAAPQHVDPSSGVEILDDDTEERGKSLLAASTTPPASSNAAAPAPAPTAQRPQPTTKESSPRGSGKGIVPREEAISAAKKYLEEGQREVPKTFLQFERTWNTLKEAERPGYLYNIPTERLCDFFKSNITEDILGDVVSVIHSTVTANTQENNNKVFSILRQLSILDRLSALLLFLDDSVTVQLRAIPKLLAGKVPDADLRRVASNLNKRIDE